ncbi:MAG TPA: carboxypeptidase regulatory-like domain-containing protein [Bryobacteraceae bacterium]|nr:carboxypeptidase regulatory-like domain-containing protein [Bryobacteraceae bacterium]
MRRGAHLGGGLAAALLLCAIAGAQALITGRVVDETGAPVADARIELRPENGPVAAVAASDRAGNFQLNPGEPGRYQIRAERAGFYVFEGKPRDFMAGANQLTITVNHVQEFSERVDVTYSPPAIDPEQPADRKELVNTEIENVPYPASQDYRNALPMMDGVVADNAGRPHFNGGDTNQTNYTLDGFNISDPVTGNLEARVNMETIQSVDLESSRFSAENGRGSAGVMELTTKTGDDRWRFGATNFFPGFSTESGVHLDKWSPRLEVSGPLAKGRAWFHNGLDAFYSVDVVHGLPGGQNRTTGFNGNDLTRFQVNLTPANILTGSFLMNLSDVNRQGLSFLNPAETTSNHRQTLYMSSIRDQAYFGGGALLDLGFADSRGLVRDLPQGDALFEITPFGSRGNYFVSLDRHFYRQQWLANLFLPTLRWKGTHQLKFGVDSEREAFHQSVAHHDYEVLRADNSVARYVEFAGSPFQARKNFEAAQYIQDRWTPREGLLFEAGVRAEWNEIVRDLEVAPRFSAVWAPGFLRNTKFSAGWGIYYDALNLELITRHQDGSSVATFFAPNGLVSGPVVTSFLIHEQALRAPDYRTASIAVEHKLPFQFYGRAGYTRRTGSHGFAFYPSDGPIAAGPDAPGSYLLRNTRVDRYDAFDISLRRTFAGQFEWFAGYTRSRSRSNAAMDYSLENPIFGPQLPGPFPWDAPDRVHMWGWAPLPKRPLPGRLRFLTRNTTAEYLVEYRTGFPFNVVDQSGFLVGSPNGARLPAYFSINLAFERRFRALHYQWAWRFGLDNLTNNGNPNAVNNVLGTPQFLTYARGQARAANVRLRLLGRK